MTLLFDADDCVSGLDLPEELDSLEKLEEGAGRVIGFVADYLECPFDIEVNLTLTDNERIREYNRDFRQIDRPTDVLSFPMVDYDEPCNFDIAKASPDEYFDPESSELLLGDIVISMEKAVEQAREYGHSIVREYYFLIVHSMLHLFGYDHIEEEDRVVMEEKQESIMGALGISR